MEKDKTLDFLRVMSMFLVIVIHMANCYCRSYIEISSFSYGIACFFNIISRVSVPIFFMISGALLIPKTITKEKYIFRIKRIFIVLLLWTVVYAIFEYFYLGMSTNYINLLVEPQRTHLWFLYAIIALYVALPFIRKLALNLTKNEENLFIGLWLLIAVFKGIISIFNLSVVYDTPIVSGTYYLGYFLIGHIIYKRVKENRESFKKYNLGLSITFCVTNLIILITTLIVSNKLGDFYNSLFTYSGALIMISSISIFILLLVNVTNPPKFILYFAPFSFGVYLVHGIFLEILKNTVMLSNISSLIAIPLFAIILFLVSYVVVYFLKKIPKISKYIC